MSQGPCRPQWGREFSDAEIEAARREGRLLTMELETSHVCNMRCVYCYNSAGRRLQNELSTAEILDVIDQAAALGLRRAILIGGGEPLMHPDIFRIIDDLHERGIGIDLFTNGTRIEADTARFLFERGVEPVVKRNSLRAEVQDELTGLPGAFERIERGLDHLFAAGYPAPGRDLGIETIVCSQNYAEIPELWRWARERGVTPYVEMITFQGRARDRRDLNVSVGRLRALFEKLAEIDRADYGIYWEPHPPVAGLSCARHEYSCTVTANGYVQPCTGVDLKVGNLRHQTLAEILAGSPVIASLRRVRENIKGACARCDLLSQCYGCRGMAYHLTGDYLAPDPLCWRNPGHLVLDEPDHERNPVS